MNILTYKTHYFTTYSALSCEGINFSFGLIFIANNS